MASSACAAFAWGWTEDGRLGLDPEDSKSKNYPHPVWGLGKERSRRPLRCAAGWRHSIFTLATGEVALCGAGPDGELGEALGTDISEDEVDLSLVRAERAKRWSAEPILTTMYTSYTTDDAALQDASIVVPKKKTVKQELSQAAAVFAGEGTSFAVSTKGELFAWGKGRYGILGLDNESNYYKPTQVPTTCLEPKFRVRRLACGRWHCVLVSGLEGKLYTWGRNHKGQLGLGADALHQNVCTPTPIELEPCDRRQPSIRDVAAGEAHTVAIADRFRGKKEEDTMAYAWGDSSDSRLGDANPKKHHTPQVVTSLSLLLERKRLLIAKAPRGPGDAPIVVCGGAHALVRTSFGQLVAWGAGSHGQLGYGEQWDRYDCVLIPDLFGVIDIAAGSRHSVAVTGLDSSSDTTIEYKTNTRIGQVFTWGFGHWGELGQGDCDIRLLPTQVRGLEQSIAVACAAGDRHTLVLTTGRAMSYRQDTRYADTIAILEHPGGRRLEPQLRDQLKETGLDPCALDDPDKPEPGQPGVRERTCLPRPLTEPATRYCLDTIPPVRPDDLVMVSARRATYETIATCKPCKFNRICRACMRHCHYGHCLVPDFCRWAPGQDQCGCLASGKCSAKWSPERAIFDNLVDQIQPSLEETLSIDHLDHLLDLLHPDENLTEDDYDAAHVALRSSTRCISWAQFNKWHSPYFSEKFKEEAALTQRKRH